MTFVLNKEGGFLGTISMYQIINKLWWIIIVTVSSFLKHEDSRYIERDLHAFLSSNMLILLCRLLQGKRVENKSLGKKNLKAFFFLQKSKTLKSVHCGETRHRVCVSILVSRMTSLPPSLSRLKAHGLLWSFDSKKCGACTKQHSPTAS